MTKYQKTLALEYTSIYNGSFVVDETVLFEVLQSEEWLKVIKSGIMYEDEVYYVPKKWLTLNLVAFISGLPLPTNECKGFNSKSNKTQRIVSDLLYNKVRILLEDNIALWGFVLDNLMASKVLEVLKCN